MPTAAVLFLQAQEDGSIYGATGQHAAGFWLNSWRKIAAEVGDALHDDRALRPFTVSPLLGLTNVSRGVTQVAAGDVARLRLTTLDDQGQAGLLAEWLPSLPTAVTIGGVPWQVQRLATAAADHPGAGAASYAELRDRPRAAPPPERWSLTFETPTAFHLQDDTILPFPLPNLLLGGWLNRWHEYSPHALLGPHDTPADFLARAAAGLRVSAYRLKTASFRFRHHGPEGHQGPRGRRDREVPQIGCVGELALDGAPLAPADRAVVSSLVDFAFFCGTGHHTTMGMGQTRIN